MTKLISTKGSVSKTHHSHSVKSFKHRRGVAQLFGLLSRGGASKHILQIRTILFLLRLCFFSTLLVFGVQAQAQALTKIGTPETTTGGEVLEGEIINWVIDVDSSSSTPVDISVLDLFSTGHTLVDGSLEYSPTWSLTSSGSNGFELDRDSLDQSASSAFLYFAPFTFAGGGDGYEPIISGTNVYVVNHHTSGDIVKCYNLVTGGICDGYGTLADPGVNLPGGDLTNPDDSGYTIYHNEHDVVIGDKLFTVIGSVSNADDYGLVCLQLSTGEPCTDGGWASDVVTVPDYTTATPVNVTLTEEDGYVIYGVNTLQQSSADRVAIYGIAEINGQLWSFDLTGNVFCTNVDGTPCIGVTHLVSSMPDGVLFGDYTGVQQYFVSMEYGPKCNFDVIGTKVYLACGDAYQDIAGTSIARATCFDTATQDICAGWEGDGTATITGYTKDFAYFGDPVYDVQDNAFPPLTSDELTGTFIFYDANMVPQAFCTTAAGIGTWAILPVCVNIDDGSPYVDYSVSNTGNPEWEALRAAFRTTYPVVSEFNSLSQRKAADLTIGTRTYFADWLSDDVVCWDWSLANYCEAPAGSSFISDQHYSTIESSNIAGVNAENYAMVKLGSCIVVFGNVGTLWAFHEETHTAEGCSSYISEGGLNAASLFCSSGLPSDFNWTSLSAENIDLTQFVSYVVTIKNGATGDELYSADWKASGITSLDLTAETFDDGILHLVYEVVAEPDVLVIGNPPVFDGDDQMRLAYSTAASEQICFQTTVDTNACLVGEINNNVDMTYDGDQSLSAQSTPITVLDANGDVCSVPSVEVEKAITLVTDTVADGIVGVGDTVDYEFTVTNTGNTSLSPVSVSDSKITSVTCVATELLAGAITTCTGSYVLEQADVDAGAVENTAEATGTPVATDPTTGLPDPTTPLTDPVTGTPIADVTDTSDAGTEPEAVAPGGAPTPITDPDLVETPNPLLENPNDPADPTEDPTTLLITPLPEVEVEKAITLVTDTVADGIVGVGDTVDYEFTVTNTGNTSLAPVTVVDTKITAVICTDSALAAGAITTCTGSYILTQVDVDAGAVENTAEATGTPVATDPTTGLPDPTTPLIDPVTSTPIADVTDTSDAGTEPEAVAPGGAPTPITDPDLVETPNPLLENPNDPADPTEDPTTLLITQLSEVEVEKAITLVTDTVADGIVGVGDTVDYEFTVTNTGNTSLAPVTVVDTKITAVICTDSALAAGASTTCTGSYILTQVDVDAGAVENTAEATGTPVATDPTTGLPDPTTPLTDPVTGTPIADVTDTSDAGTEPEAVAPGGAPTPITDPDLVETPNPLLENPNDPADPTEDPTTLLITPLPEVEVEKAITLVTDTVADGIVGVGDTVDYEFTVTNTGNTSLAPVTVVDTKITTVICTDSALAAGASTTCTGSYILTQVDVDAGAVENTAEATGTPVATDPTTGLPDPTMPLTDPVTGTPIADVTDTSDAGTEPEAVAPGGAPTPITDPDLVETPNPLLENPNDPADPTEDPTTLLITPLPEVEVEKAITLVTDTVADGIVGVGDTVDYEFTVTNTGNTSLAPVTVVDTKITAVICTDNALAAGASTTCTGSYVLEQADVDAGAVENTAEATVTPVATDPTTGLPDPSTPLIDPVTSTPIADVTDTSDAGTEPEAVVPGGTPTPITDPELVETPNPLLENPDDDLDPTDDPTTLLIAPMPEVEVVKAITLVTDTVADGIVGVGDTVDYLFTVTNTGNTSLAPVTVVDTKITTVSCTDSALAAGASTTCTGSYILTQADVDAGAVENTAEATGTPVATDPETGLPDPTMALIDPVTSLPLEDVTDTSDAGTEPEAVAPGGAPTVIPDPELVETDNPLLENPDDDLDPTDDPTTLLIAPMPEVEVVKAITLVTDTVADGIVGVGDTVDYEFTVTNTGNTSLAPVTVVDTKITTVICTDSALAAGASTTCTGSYILTQVDVDAGAVENTAEATGTPVATDPTTGLPDPTTPLTDPVTGTPIADVTDTSDAGTEPEAVAPGGAPTPITDPDLVETPNPLLENPNDPADPTEDPTTLLITQLSEVEVEKAIILVTDTVADGIVGVGDTVDYEFTVTNTGNTSLAPVTVVDTKITAVICTDNALAAGASTTCTGSYILTQVDVDAGAVENTAEATVTPVATDPTTGLPDPTTPLIDPVTSTPIADVTDTSDAGTEPEAVAPGGAPTPITDPDLVETPNPLLENPNDPADPTEDPTTLLITQLSEVEVEKAIILVTDTVADGIVGVGDTVDYEFTVTNTGNTSLAPVTVVDTKITAVICTDNALAAGASTTCTGSYILTQVDVDAGAVENTAEATVTPVATDPTTGLPDPTTPLIDPVTSTPIADVTDTSDAGTEPEAVAPGGAPTPITDPDLVETPNPLLENPNDPADPTEDPTTLLITQLSEVEVEKAITLVTDTVADGIVGVGDTVDYEFTVTNTGNTSLAPVTVVDTKITAVICTDNALAAGASTTCTGSYILTQVDVDAGAVENTAEATGTPVATDPTTGLPDPTTPLTDPVTGTPIADVTDTSDAGTEPEAVAPGGAPTPITDPDLVETPNPLLENPNDPADPTEDPTTLLITPLPEVEVEKAITLVTDTVADGIVGVGDTVDYEFTVTNTGNTSLAPVTVVDTKITTVICTDSALAAGASTTCTGSYILTQVDVDAGAVENTAEATGTPVATDPTTGLPDPTTPLIDPVTSTPIADVTDTSDAGTEPEAVAPGGAPTPITDPDLVETPNPLLENPNDPADPTEDPTTLLITPLPEVEVEKAITLVTDTVADGIVGVGDTVDYEFTVTNTGNTSLAPVTVVDTKITAVICTDSALAAGAITTCTGSYILTQVDVDAGAVENTAEATGTPVATDPTTGLPDPTTPLIDPVTSTPIADVTDTSDAGTEPEAVAPGGAPTPITDPDLVETPNPLLENPNDPADPTEDPTTLLITPLPEVEVEKAITLVTDTVADGIVGVGDTVDYEFTVTNTGNTSLAPVTVVDTKITTVICTDSALAAGASTTCTGSYILTQVDVDAGAVENTAEATGTPVATDPTTGLPDPTTPLIDPVTSTPIADVTDTSDAGTEPEAVAPGGAPTPITDPDLVETPNPLLENPNDPADPTEDPTTLLITPLPEVEVEKAITLVTDTVADGIVGVGDTVDYEFTVTNTGNTSLAPVTVVDTKITTVICTDSALAAGASTTCTGSYILTQVDVDAGAVENTAEATGTPVATDPTTGLPDPTTPLIDPVTSTPIADVTDTSDAGTEPEAVAPGGAPTPITDPDLVETPNPLLENPNDPADPTEDPTTLLITPLPEVEVEKAITLVTDTVADGIVGVGDTVDYEFTVTNTGNTSLAPVTVVDTKITAVICTDSALAAGAITTCTGSYILTQVDVDAGAVENTAEATGTPVATDPTTGLPDPTTPLIDPVTSTPIADVTDTSDAGTEPEAVAPGGAPTPITDPDLVETPNPLLENPNDPADPTEDPTTLLITPLPEVEVEKAITLVTDTVADGIVGVGDTVDYEFTVTNTGNTSLAPVTVVDTKITTVICTDSALAAGASTTCTGSYILTQVDVDAGAVENTAEATGTPVATDPTTGLPDPTTPLIDPVTSTPIADVTDTSDAGTEPEAVAPGGAPTPITDPDLVETPNPLLENPNDPADPTEDPTTLLITPLPEVEVEKAITLVTDTVADGIVGVGDTVDYEFTVTNTGNTSLAPVTVVDTKITTVICTDSALAAGASTTCTGSYILTQVDVDAGAVENTAEATGTPVATDPTTGLPDPTTPLIDPVTSTPIADVTDTSDAGTEPEAVAPGGAPTPITDPDLVETPNPLLENPNDPADPTEDPTTLLITPLPEVEVEKAITLVTDTVADGIVGVGDTVDYEFTVTNTGNTSLAPVTVVDTKITAVICTDSALAAGAITTCTGSYILTQVDVDAGAVENTAEATGTPVTTETDPTTGDPVPGTTVLIDPVTGVELPEVTDKSDAGTEPEVVPPGGTPTPIPDPKLVETDSPIGQNPNDPLDPTEDPTTLLVTPMPAIEVSKTLNVGSPVDLGGGNYQVTFDLEVENTGNVTLHDVQVTDDLVAMVNRPHANYATFSGASVSSGDSLLSPNPSFDGSSDINLLTGTDMLPVGQIAVISVTFTFTPDVYYGPFDNVATASGLSPNNESVNDTDNDLFQMKIDTTTPITLGWLRTSDQGDGKVLFEWTTETEVANVGYILWVQGADEQWIPLNDQMIVSQGDSLSIQYYEYLASDIEGTVFRITDVGVSGKLEHHGPYELGQMYGVQADRKATDWNEINRAADRKEKVRDQQRRDDLERRMQMLRNQHSALDAPIGSGQVVTLSDEANGQRSTTTGMVGRFMGLVLSTLIAPAEATELLNFGVESAGIYRVTHEQLVDEGVDLSSFPTVQIGLKSNNQLVPVKLELEEGGTFGAGSWIEFTGEGKDTLYTGTNQYTLVLGEGQVLISPDDRVLPEGPVAYSYLAEKTYAPANGYTHHSPDRYDPWYADKLDAIDGPVQKTVDLYLDDHAPAYSVSGGSQNADQLAAVKPRLEVNLWGASALPGNGLTNPDHHVQIDLNGTQVADERFDGIRVYTVKKPLSQLVSGNNQIKIKVPNDDGYQFDLMHLDRVTLSYPRHFKAEEGGESLVFPSAWNKFRVRGLSQQEATVYRVDGPGATSEMSTKEGKCYEAEVGCIVTFAGGSGGAGSVYYVSTGEGIKTPTISVAPAYEDLFTGNATHLVIAHPDFIGTANGSLEVYVSELAGIYGSSDLVSVDSIYAQYSGHVLAAESIQAYIKEAYSRRGTRQVTLVGGDMNDYRDNLNSGARSFVPSLYVRIGVNLNAVPSDSKYGDLDDDNIPDLAVTRLPVRTEVELERLLNKRTRYLARDNHRDAVFAAEKVDDEDGYSFKADSQELIANYFGDWDEVTTAYIDDVGVAVAKATLVSEINAGVSLTTYIGHSGTNYWSKSGLLLGDEIAGLTNTQSPTVVAQWGCWNTFYVDPEIESMVQRFLLENDQGAVTVMGATSLASAFAEKKMASLLYERLNQGMRLGEAALSAKRKLAESSPYQYDMLLGWAMLGPMDMVVNNAN